MGTRAGRVNEAAAAKGRLAELLPKLGEAKANKKLWEDAEKPLVTEVKQQMSLANLTAAEVGEWKATITERSNEAMNEAVAIDILKEELASEPAILQQVVKTREYIDTDKLESLIYTNQIDSAMLATAIEKKPPTVVLTVKKKKGKK